MAVHQHVEHLRIFDPQAFPGELTLNVRHFIKLQLWPKSSLDVANFDGFFKHFASTIQAIAWTNPSFDTVFAATTYGDLKQVIASLRGGVSKPKREVVSDLTAHFPGKTPEQCARTLEFAAGLWTTLAIQISSQDISHLPNDFEWANDISLQSLASLKIPKYHPPPGTSQSLESLLLDKQLNASKLNEVCRVDIQWTNNLADHLTYDIANDRVYIYPHKACLVGHLENIGTPQNVQNSLDAEVLRETIRTLDFLLPWTPTTSQFLRRQGLHYSQFYYKNSAYWSEAVDLSEFRYWRRRLTQLQAIFNRPPTTLNAMWFDRRRPLQWMTFWLAGIITILTVIFGLISSYASFKQIELAQKAYELSLAQACSPTTVLRSFCAS